MKFPTYYQEPKLEMKRNWDGINSKPKVEGLVFYKLNFQNLASDFDLQIEEEKF